MAGYRFGAKPDRVLYYDSYGTPIYSLDEDYMKSAQPNDSVDQLEDAWLDYLPWRIMWWTAIGYMNLTLFMFLFGLIGMCLTSWNYPPFGALMPTFFLTGIIAFIIGCIGSFFLVPAYFPEYKKWRKAQRRFANAKD